MAAFVEVFQTETGASGEVGNLPQLAMRLAALAMRLVKPSMARQIQAGIVMDTRPQAFDAVETRRRYPSISATSLAQVVRRDFATARSTAHGSPSHGHA